MYMKRLNPKTNAPFTRGDVREDGRVFYNYTNTTKANGFFVERWVKAETLKKTKEYDRDRKNSKYVRTTTHFPKNFQSRICNNDSELIAGFKHLWRMKTNGSTDEDLLYELEAYPELKSFFFPDKE
jgi:hypothetical protein